MPSFRSINIALHSQFDVKTLPEYYPLPPEHYISCGIARAAPQLVDDATSTCSVYTPVLPGSTFWIGYSVSPPVPDGHYFLFKLYINGAHIVSWSTGKEEGWRGKTMFALYERPEDEDGKKNVEKRVLCFTPPNSVDKTCEDVKDPFDETMCMEIKVHRAHGRKRVKRELKDYDSMKHAKHVKGINLVNAGRASSEHPKRFYKFALTDPVDQPLAMFRYFYRTWEQLRDLGLLDDEWQGAGEENDMSIIEPYEGSVGGDEARSGTRTFNRDTEDVFHGCVDSAVDSPRQDAPSADGKQRTNSPTKTAADYLRNTVKAMTPSTAEASLTHLSISEHLRAYVPRGAPCANKEALDGQTQQRHSDMRTPPQSYRLSIPPSVRLDPPYQAIRQLPTIPHKPNCSSSTAYRPHPAYPVEEWRMRTPSPVKSIRDGISTPPLEKHREQGVRASSLINVISSTWKRRGTPSSESHSSADTRSGVRSAS